MIFLTDCPENFEVLICECCREDSPRRPNIATCVESLLEILEEISDPSIASGGTTILPIYKPQVSPTKRPIILGKDGPSDVIFHPRVIDVADKIPTRDSQLSAVESPYFPTPTPAIQSRIASLEQELENLKREARLTESMQQLQQQQQQQQQQQAQQQFQGVPPTENLLGAILEKINSLEVRLSSSEPPAVTKTVVNTRERASPIEDRYRSNSPSFESHESGSVVSDRKVSVPEAAMYVPVTPPQNTSQVNPGLGASTHIQQQLDEFSAIVDQAVETRAKLKDNLSRSGTVSPNDARQIGSASTELSTVLDSFMDVINKCSFLSSRADGKSYVNMYFIM